MMEEKTGRLYVVATPIGNLEDITLRAIRVLKEVSLIAAEDTRRTKKLLNAYGIQTPVVSLYDHVEKKRSDILIARMKEGKDVAYVSDAGTPGISDPGYVLVNRSLARGIQVVPVPGASAAIATLSVAGLPMNSFVFIGFQPVKTAKRRLLLESLRNEKRTMVFYESPRRIMGLLKDLRDVLGNRTAVFARELTKVFEEIRRGSLDEIIDGLEGRELKGEVTLVVAGGETGDNAAGGEKIRTLFEELNMGGEHLSAKELVREIASATGLPKKEVYREVLKLLEERR